MRTQYPSLTKLSQARNGSIWRWAAAYLICLLPWIGQADSGSYSIAKIAQLGTAAPNGGDHINDFEPGAINNRGDVIYGTDLGTSSDPSTFFGEGVFLQRGGEESELARGGGAAPGGGVFDFLLLGQTVLNDQGDGAFAFTLSPFSLPVGVNSGVYRYSHITQEVTPVLVAGSTPAPGGGTFLGAFFNTSLNNQGALIFPALIATANGIHIAGEAYTGVGMGVFQADTQNHIASIASPGDAAPGGGTFDCAGNGGLWNNASGDVVFTAHVAGEEVQVEGAPPQSVIITALDSLYLKRAATGTTVSLVHAGDPAPGGGVFRAAFAPVMNARGDVVFTGDLTPAPHNSLIEGIFLRSGNTTVAVARPGDAMPGGGTFVTGSVLSAQQTHLNNLGEVAFNASLTDINGDGGGDTGLFVWSKGSVQLVAHTGTVIPGVGTIAQLVMGVITIPPPAVLTSNSGAINNDRGQVLFGATLTDGSGVLLVATPAPAQK
ncbi:MAG TPA: choice-of-anchor tandem repeat NxxGxxAF-containing protein [Candidatus Limnocylindrales bacterium]|nr:choice-of-anchor tandem repeat NxxGxxAF-containing protein [Candidatus Limnocylindrales bacterium]